MAPRFDLAWRWVPAPPNGSGGWVVDYLIDGQSLFERCTKRMPGEAFLSPITYSIEEDVLLPEQPPDLDGRVAIFVCWVCGDLDCGAVTVVIERDGDEIVWRDLAHSYPDWDSVDEAWVHREYPDLSELRFDSTAYRAAIAALPAETPGWPPDRPG